MIKNNKQGAINLKIWIPIACIFVIGITFYLIYSLQKKVEMKQEKSEISEEFADLQETGEAEVAEENSDESESISNEKIENSITMENQTVVENTNNGETVGAAGSYIPGATNEKQKAIELVKKEWGDDDLVDFVFDYINEKGEYVIAVKDRETATVKYYFRVNLETENVELD